MDVGTGTTHPEHPRDSELTLPEPSLGVNIPNSQRGFLEAPSPQQSPPLGQPGVGAGAQAGAGSTIRTVLGVSRQEQSSPGGQRQEQRVPLSRWPFPRQMSNQLAPAPLIAKGNSDTPMSSFHSTERKIHTWVSCSISAFLPPSQARQRQLKMICLLFSRGGVPAFLGTRRMEGPGAAPGRGRRALSPGQRGFSSSTAPALGFSPGQGSWSCLCLSLGWAQPLSPARRVSGRLRGVLARLGSVFEPGCGSCPRGESPSCLVHKLAHKGCSSSFLFLFHPGVSSALKCEKFVGFLPSL